MNKRRIEDWYVKFGNVRTLLFNKNSDYSQFVHGDEAEEFRPLLTFAQVFYPTRWKKILTFINTELEEERQKRGR